MTCLAHFISVVCETGAASLLCTFSFAGLEADLERNLAFRARNSDPLGKPNYYKVLYAYHVAKGDYRSGTSRSAMILRWQGKLTGVSDSRYGHVPGGTSTWRSGRSFGRAVPPNCNSPMPELPRGDECPFAGASRPCLGCSRSGWSP